MSDEPLFPGYDPPTPEPGSPQDPGLSADQRRTRRQAADVARGVHPLTGGPLHPLASRHRDAAAPKDDPFTCGSCYFRVPGAYRSWPKCVAHDGARVTSGAASDVRAWWPACPDWTGGDTALSPDAARSVPPPEC